MIVAYEDALTGTPSRFEVERDGRALDLDIVPLREGGAVTHALVFLHDVTERRLEADDLRGRRDQLTRERGLLAATLDNIDDGVVLLDANRKILVANPAFSSMFGFDDASIAGLPRAEIVGQMASCAESRVEFLAHIERPPLRHDEFVFVRPRPRTFRRTWTDITLGTERGRRS